MGKNQEEIEKNLRAIVDQHVTEVWNDALRNKIQSEVMEYFTKLGIGARKIEINCDEDGYVSVYADEFFWRKEAN
jgi:hypothetical protein